VTSLPTGLVTFLMTDIERSTELLRRIGKDSYTTVLATHQEILEASVRTCDGTMVDMQGDSTFAVFQRPSDAIRAAAQAQRALTAERSAVSEARVRMGVHTGEASPSEGTYHGLAVHRSARICAEAVAGQVLVSQSTVSVLADTHTALDGVHLADCGERRLKDFEQPVRLYQVIAQEEDSLALTPHETIAVLIVDDQALVRTGFRMILEAETDLVVVGEAGDGAEAVNEARRTTPDVILMDVRMPNVDGLEATRRILDGAEHPPRVLILTTFDLDEYVYEALRVGASGFLLKDTPPEQLVEAIHVVARGDALLAPSITRRIIEEYVLRPPASARKPAPELDELTTRELEMLRYLARGLSNAEIAKAAFVSEATVKTHVAHILMKLHLRDRVQAVVFAYENDVVAPGANE